ncbi:MAG: PRC-barrel domain-containing protein [Acetobacteraceae bacterium]
MLTRRLVSMLAVLVALNEAARADTAPAPPAIPAPKLAPKPAVEPVDKDQVVAILGRPVTGPGKQQIGTLTDVLVDGTGQPQAGVLDIGGFMGVGARTIAVHWNLLHFSPADPKAPITLSLTLDQIKAVPEYKGIGNKPAPVVVRSDVKPAPAH